MKQVTGNMIKIYKLRELNFDFAGYTFTYNRELSFHHLVTANKNVGECSINNGAILKKNIQVLELVMVNY